MHGCNKQIENRGEAYDGDSESELFRESDSEEYDLSSQSTTVCPHCFNTHEFFSPFSLMSRDDGNCLYQRTTDIVLDFHHSRFITRLAQSLKLPPLPPSSTHLDLFSYIQYNLSTLEQLNTGDYHLLSRRQLVIWRLFSTVFGRELQSSSIGSLYFIRHMLSRIWSVTREQGDLLLFAVLITFCRVYSRIHHVDVLQYVEHTQGVDLDNVLLTVSEMFDHKQIF